MNTAAVMTRLALVAALVQSGALFADTLTIDPGDGVATNVTRRITDDTDVAVNPGASGGGIVTLGPRNTYTGTTSLGCGTLVATMLGDTGSSFGSTSGITLGAGTLRYAGADGGVLSAAVTSSFASSDKKACVLDVQNDLVVTNNWTQKYGTFIKTGPGTVTFRGKNNFIGAVNSTTRTSSLDDRTHKLAFNVNGDGPAVGVRGGFVLAEGKMIIEGDDTTTNYLNGASGYGAIGTWTADNGEQEKSAVLEIRGGYNYMPRAVWLGYHNGTAATGGDNVSSGLRVAGGYLRIGATNVATSDNDTMFVGSQTSANGTQLSHPFIEVSGGHLDIAKNLQLGNRAGVHTRVHISGDGRLTTGQYTGIGYSAEGTTTNSVTLSGNGVLETRYIEMRTAAGKSQCDVNLLDDSTFVWTVTNTAAFNKQENSTKGVMNIFIDGGTVSNSYNATSITEVPIFHPNTDYVAIGTRGATFAGSGTSTIQFKYGLRVPFVATNTVDGMEPRPVNFLSGNSKKTTYNFYSEFDWPGSVRLGPFAYIYVQSGAKFATDGTFVHCKDARLISNVDSPAFKNYQIGEVGVTGGDATLFLTSGSHVSVTGEFKVASTTGLIVYMRASGASWTAGGTTYTTPGEYTVLTVPASCRSELERLKTSYAYAGNCSSCFFIQDNGNGTVSLKLWIYSASSGSTTTVTDFADGSMLGAGTLEYAGAGEETTGFAIKAPGAAVLKTSGTLTVTGGVETMAGALIKTGSADLKLAGSGSYSFAGNGVGWSATATDNEIGENGESPVAGYRGLSVREGKVVVGSQPDDAPTVTASSLSVGSNPAATDIPAELIVSNGTVNVVGNSYISPADGRQNRIELSGGTLSLGGTFDPGDMSGMDVEGRSPGMVEINDGGRLVFGGKFQLYNGDKGEMEVDLNEGGVISAYSDFTSSKSTVPYRGTLRLNGGTYSYGSPDKAPYLRYVNVLLGAKGVTFDGEERFANGGEPTANYLHIAGTWAKDPALGDAPDGGIVFRGRALFYFGGAFTAAIEGPVVVRDQAQLMAIRSVASGLSVSVRSGCGIRSYQNSADPTVFKDLHLGESGVPGSVRLEIRGNDDIKAKYSIVVSNEFETLSPVCFAARAAWNSLNLTMPTGVYTAIVYRAECDANVDVSKFYLDPAMANRNATFEKADIASGSHAGWKAIVVRVASGTGAATPDDTSDYPHWTATSAGGNWSNPANWAGGVRPDASHFAVFGAPGAAGVAVTLDVEPSMEKLYIEGTDANNGYTFGGSRPFGFDGGASALAQMEIAGGDHTVNAPLKIDRALALNAAAGSVVTIDGTIGDGTLTLNSSGVASTGKVVLESVGGGLAAGFGRTEVSDLSFANASGALSIGSGTLAYTGVSPADDVSLTLAPNRTDENVAAVFENVADVRVTEVVGGNKCALIKTGTGTLALRGTNTMQFKGTASWANTASDLISADGNAPTTCFRGLNVAQGTIAVGVVGDDANAPVVTADNVSVSLCCSPTAAGTAASLLLNKGSLDITSNLLIGNFTTRADAILTARYEQNGGTSRMTSVFIGYAGSGSSQSAVRGEFVLNDGDCTISSQLYASHGRRKFEGQENVITVNGGMLSVKDVVGVSYAVNTGYAVPSAIKVNDGEFNVSRNYTFTYRKNETHTLELNGGVFRIGGYMKASTNNATCTGISTAIKFNGGEFRPLTAAPSIESEIDALVGEGGAVVSTAEVPGGVCTLSAALKHDPALAGADGGLVKKGAGTLVLSGANTYTGPTVVEDGTLKSTGAIQGVVDVRYGATFDLDGGAQDVGSISGAGEFVNGTVRITGSLTACSGFDEVPFVDGNLTGDGRICVDIGVGQGDPVPRFGTRFLLAEVTGSVDIRLRPVDGERRYRLVPVVEDGFLYAVVEPPFGAALTIR